MDRRRALIWGLLQTMAFDLQVLHGLNLHAARRPYPHVRSSRTRLASKDRKVNAVYSLRVLLAQISIHSFAAVWRATGFDLTWKVS